MTLTSAITTTSIEFTRCGPHGAGLCNDCPARGLWVHSWNGRSDSSGWVLVKGNAVSGELWCTR